VTVPGSQPVTGLESSVAALGRGQVHAAGGGNDPLRHHALRTRCHQVPRAGEVRVMRPAPIHVEPPLRAEARFRSPSVRREVARDPDVAGSRGARRAMATSTRRFSDRAAAGGGSQDSEQSPTHSLHKNSW